jgi:hypothetical protein
VQLPILRFFRRFSRPDAPSLIAPHAGDASTKSTDGGGHWTAISRRFGNRVWGSGRRSADDAVSARQPARTVVGLNFVSSAEFVSPGYETVATLVTVGNAALPTLTVSVIAVFAPGANAAELVQVTV